ncbi:MAG: protein kinase [Myxococcales bacterium]|nr:protein kinase [Myxococcales bacterium]
MEFPCPYCGRSNDLSGKPGRYEPVCRGCHRPFELFLPADPAEEPAARRLPGVAEDEMTPPLGVRALTRGYSKPELPREPEAAPLEASLPMGRRPTREWPRLDEADAGPTTVTPPPAPEAAPRPARRPSGVKASPFAGEPATTRRLSHPELDAPKPEQAVPPRRASHHELPSSATFLDEEPTGSHPGPPPGIATPVPSSSSAGERTVDVRPHRKPAGPSPEAAEPEMAQTLPEEDEPASERDTAPEPPPPEAPVEALAESLGGYELKVKIGKGGMGTVYLARQVSLDRKVALKVLHPSLSADPVFVTRFTREAYAAAQLVHHNIVQIYDIGEKDQTYFFSMEYIEGESLAALVKREEKLDPEVAAGYVLQVARGLRFAHAHGMIHRDIKPENLMLNTQGIVKVADLGLVKRAEEGHKSRPSREEQLRLGEGSEPSTDRLDVTQDRYAMGTPAYMAPEQARDPSKVDGRADIYSLGCTFYELLTGNPPFKAESIAAYLSKHAFDEVTPPERVVKRIPKSLSDIVLRMVAKKQEQRYRNMAELATALEMYLGIDATGPFSPREEHANLLEGCVQAFNGSAWAKGRRIATACFALLGALLSGGFLWWGRPLLVGVAVGFVFSTWFVYFVLAGLLRKDFLLIKFRQLVLGSPIAAWVVWGLLMAAGGYALYRFQLHFHALGVLGAALVASIGFYLVVDRKVAAQRRLPIEDVNRMLRSMRLRGIEENALRQFVCKYSGEHWEAFFEALFGYEAKLLAREKWGRTEGGQARKKFGAWREPLIRGIDAVQKRRAEKKERKLLEKVEEKAAEAGVASEERGEKIPTVPGRRSVGERPAAD